MMKVSIIIPYYQRDKGILKRAIESALTQRLSLGVYVDIIIVDDGSPVSANSELEGIIIDSPFNLVLINQKNAGVAAARNTGLNHVDKATRYIAFLDSDDIWYEKHLDRGIHALESGHDFYFCDNKRTDYHDSYFKECSPELEKATKGSNCLAPLSPIDLTTIILKDFATQASTVIYRRDIYPDLLFDENFKKAGEDLIFFVKLSAKAKNPCCYNKVMVECGRGVNIFFSNFSWDSPEIIPITISQIKAHRVLDSYIPESMKKWNIAFIRKLQKKLIFLTIRHFIKNRNINHFAKDFIISDDEGRKYLYANVMHVTIGKLLGFYKPS